MLLDRRSRSAQWFDTPGKTSISRGCLWNRGIGGVCRGVPRQFTRWGHRFLVSLEWLPEDGLLFFWGRSRISNRRLGCRGGGTRRPVYRNEILAQHLDKIRREQARHAPVTPQSTHPPLSIPSIQVLDQIPLHESQVLFCFSSPRVDGSTPARMSRGKLGRGRRHCS